MQRVVITTQNPHHGIAQDIGNVAVNRLRNVCPDNQRALIDAWRKPFAAAAATLIEAHHRIGGIPLEDTATILQHGDDIADVWTRAITAVRTIDAINNGWLAFTQFPRTAPADPRNPILRIADVDYPTWDARQLDHRKAKPWDAVRDGPTLSLPKPAEYRARVAALEAGRLLATLGVPPLAENASPPARGVRGVYPAGSAS